ncbi:MAG: AMP-binding protein [Candidatus Krumholzibacteriota bacterium]|nr:AMP-binding protein [Candidatus Krumholzibacteriota bacterium]
MLLQEFLEESAARHPGKEALVAGQRRLSYREIDVAANRLANALLACGVAEGDRVAVLMDNSPEAVVSIWGILKAGAVFLVINPTTKREKIRYILDNCRAAALITHSGKWRTVGRAVEGVCSLKAILAAGPALPPPPADAPAPLPWEETLAGQPGAQPPLNTIDIDLAALIYTSGTTGNPKGVMLTHRNMVSAATSITTYLENTPEDRILSVLPLSFDYGLYQAIMAARFGGALILERSFLYPWAVVNLLREERATGFPIVPTISAILLQMEEIRNEAFPDLRYITNTAAALPVSHITGLRGLFPGADIYSMYGLTECKRVSFLPPAELDRRPESVGRGMPNEQVWLVDEAGEKIEEPDRIGELVVRGANVMQGYWELPEETAARLRPGKWPWEKVLYTGDLFRMDEEGFLYFVSRRDDIIKSRGEKVSPKEIEGVVYAMEGVVEAAVVGVPDEILGEAIKLFVVRREGSAIGEKDVLAHCKAHLEDFMIPSIVEFRDALPKTTTGKITTKGLA